MRFDEFIDGIVRRTGLTEKPVPAADGSVALRFADVDMVLMPTYVEEMLLGGNGRAACSHAASFQNALQQMQKDVATAVKRLWTGFSNKDLQELDVMDVFGKLGQVVDGIIMSKEKKTERQVMRRVQNDQRNVFSEQDRIARCQRVRGVIVRVLAAMGYEMKIENKDDNEVLKLVQGNRILELPEE